MTIEMFASWSGRCPVCEQDTTFSSQHAWFRDHLLCAKCPGGSIPRERALMQTIRQLLPNWQSLNIHESSPGNRGTSVVLARDCPNYIASQYFTDIPSGQVRNGVRSENIERQTFADASFDLVVTQDVMEHVFNPDAAYREIWRTLKPGGFHIHTTPIYKHKVQSERRAALRDDGTIQHLAEPEYHGNPIDPQGSLVTFHFGYDLADLIAEWAPFDVEIRRYNARGSGIVAEFSEVIVCQKR